MKHQIQRLLCAASCLLISALLAPTTQAGKVQGFEPGDPAISSTGDVGTKGTYQSDSPTEGSFQLLLTTVGTTGMDDGVVSQSGNPAVSISALQTFFGLTLMGQEGSGVLIPFTVSVGDLQLSFDYDFLSNEPFQSMPHGDYVFAAIFNSSNALQGSASTFADVGGSTFELFGAQSPFVGHTGYNTMTFSVSSLAPGNYQLGVGVVDVTNVDHASGVLLDNVQIASVPEPSIPALTIAGAALLLGLRRRIKGA